MRYRHVSTQNIQVQEETGWPRLQLCKKVEENPHGQLQPHV